jgi:hypothetical protein
MSELRTCYLPNVTALCRIGVDHLDLYEALQRHGAEIVVSDMTELRGWR